jgi:hypothetical protein
MLVRRLLTGVVALIPAMALGDPAVPAEVRVEYRFDAPRLEKAPKAPRGKAYHRVRIEGLESWGAPGQPVVPYRLARIVLAAGTTVESVDVEIGRRVAVPGRLHLEPGRIEHSPLDHRVPPEVPPDPTVYERDAAYPPSPWEFLGVGFQHGRAVALLRLCPLVYEPKRGAVSVYEHLDVVVRTRRLGAGELEGVLRLEAADRTLSPERRAELVAQVDNSNAAIEPRQPLGIAPEPRAPEDGEGAGAGETTAYAIVTSAALAAAFEPLAQARTRGGLPAQVFTTDWIYSRYDGTRPDGRSDDAVRVRNFITDYYLHHGLRYVLLGGDADGAADCEECEPAVVPVRYLQSQALFAAAIPSDLYFGCLDGSFDADRDGVWGEPNDGPGGGDVDLLFEVHVGRAPVDSAAEAENFVRKTLAYEATNGPLLRRVLLAGEELGFGGQYDFGDTLNEAIRLGSEEFISTLGFESSPQRHFFEVSTLYDGQSRWTPAALVERLERGVHVVNHVGHADITSVMKLTAREADALRNQDPFVAYSQSCYAGAFDNQRTHGAYGSDSIAEHLLTGPRGAVAFVANSRRGWAGTQVPDGPSQRYNRRFWDAVLRSGVLGIAEANDRSKEASIAYIQANDRARWCAYELNTLGDPALVLKLAGREGSLTLDRSFYNPGDDVRITLIDADLNAVPLDTEIVSLAVRAPGSGDEESVDLIESGPSSGVFVAVLDVEAGPAARGDGVLQTAPRDDFAVVYDDADDGSGLAVRREARARVVPELRLDEPCPAAGALGVPYSEALRASGGEPPYRFSIQEGYREELREPFFFGIGYGQGWTADDNFWDYALDFPFPFYGSTYEVVRVSSNGFLELGDGNAVDFANSVEKLISNRRIAVLWADLVTSGAGDIYTRDTEDSVSFRWAGESYLDGENANAEVELFRDGRIRFGYGVGNTSLSPTIGVSAGDGVNFVISSLNGREDLSVAPSVHFLPNQPPPGLSLNPTSGVLGGLPSEVFAGEVLFRLDDALGQVTTRICRLDVLPDGITVLAPTAESLPWLAGSDQTILWDWIGEVGEILRIDYNTTGSTTDFPFAVTPSVPLGERAFRWRLPQLTAPRARIRLQSLEAPRFFTYSDVFAIVGPTILLHTPNGGEVWTAGEGVVVGWENIGATGDRVRVAYSTDGSSTVFPFVIAASAVNSGSLQLIAPDTPSESCRVSIQSLSVPSAADASAGVFAIRPPTLEVTSPAAGGCFRAGSDALVTWLAAGQTGSEVVLEYNTDGASDRFPFAVAPGPVPNSGVYLWRVPFTLSVSCRLRVRSASEPRYVDVSGVFSISSRCAIRAVIWVPFVSTAAEQVIGVLGALRQFEPDFEPFLSDATTPEALRSDLAGKDAMVVPRQKRDTEPNFEELGRTLRPVLEEFLARGGALVVCEQTSRSEVFLRSTGLLDFEHADRGTRLCEVAAPEHALAVGLRPNFGGPISTSWFSIPTPDAEHVVTVGPDLTVVAARHFGFGRLSFLGFDYYNYTSDTARILANAVRVELPADGLKLVRPRPGAVFFSGQPLEVAWFALGRARGPMALAYGTGAGPGGFPNAIGEGETRPSGDGSFAWRAPAPAPKEDFLAVRIRVASLAAPGFSDEFQEPFFVIRPLVIQTSSLPEASVGVPYEALLEASGGVPPYRFRVEDLPAGLIAEDLPPRRARIRGLPQEPCPNCEVLVVVEDAAGLTAQRFLPFPVVPREIQLLDPDGGELLLFGSPYTVRWRTSGEVGMTVSLRFNTTGSRTEFPDLIAKSAPIDQPFVWNVPPITANSCRLEVRSNESPEVFATSRGTFSIVGPSIRLDAPNGGECWVPGTVRRVRWRSVGNTAGRVRLEYNTDGSPADFPLPVASDLPPNGEYLWTVPATLSETCRLRASFDNAPEIADASDAPFAISEDCGASVVFWSPCPGVETNQAVMLGALEERIADLETASTQTRSPESLAAILPNRDAVVVPLASICQTLDYEALGREFRALLGDFVRGGGVVVFCAPNSFSSRLVAGLGLLDRLRVIRSQAGLPCEVVSYLHPIAAGVPIDFEGPLSTTAFSLVGASFGTLVASGAESVVSALDDGAGRWVILGFNFQVSNAASGRILANSARMRRLQDGLRVLSPRPGAVLVGGAPVEVSWAAHGSRSGALRLAYGRGAGEQGFPFEIAVVGSGASGGSFTWPAPPPPPGSFLTLSLEVRWVEEPALAARSEAPFHVVERALSIDTVELPVGRLETEYRAEIVVSGGVPPYAFAPGRLPSGLGFVPPAGPSSVALIRGVPLETVADLPFRLEVEDALGSRAAANYHLRVLPSRLILRSPSGGEFLLAGSVFRVEWEVRGNVGETVRVEYNLTGSTAPESFDQLAAAAAPVGDAFLWTVPHTLSERCRMRIRSNERSHESTSEGTFTISGPGVTCLFPDGGEALETDTVRTLRWRSLGNPSGRVRLELLRERAPAAPVLLIDAEAPDTGSYAWRLPFAAWESCRLRITSTADASLSDSSEGPFALRDYSPVRALVWVPYTSHDEPEVRGAIAAVTVWEHDFDWRLSAALTPEALQRELRGKESFIAVQQERRGDVSFAGRGAELGPVLRDFVERGGTVVVLKQLGAAQDFLPATGLLQAVELGSAFDVECDVPSRAHPVTIEMPGRFHAASATSWYEVQDPDAQVYVTYKGQAVAAGRDIGDGRVVLIGFDYRDYTPESARLLANAVRPGTLAGRAPFVRGDADASGRLDIVDAVTILHYLFRGAAAPSCLDALDADDSAAFGRPLNAVTITDAVYLLGWLFLGTAPPPSPAPAGTVVSPETCGLEPTHRDGLGCEEYGPCAGTGI